MINCILGLVADAGKAVQDITQKAIEGVEKAVTDPANAEKATFVNASEVHDTLKFGSLVVLSITIVYSFGKWKSISKIPFLMKLLIILLIAIAIVFWFFLKLPS